MTSWTLALRALRAGSALLVVPLGGEAKADDLWLPTVVVGPGKSSYRNKGDMRVFEIANAPYGAVRFCEVNPGECVPSSDKDRFQLTQKRRTDLDEVNRYVNEKIEPVTDLELYGVTELWTLPADKGDCEDYALLKRKMLMERGWPASALLMTVVRDEKGDGHAVLTARTMQGDYILDNKIPEVRLWQKTPYEFVMRQSYLNPKVWVSLAPPVEKAHEVSQAK